MPVSETIAGRQHQNFVRDCRDNSKHSRQFASRRAGRKAPAGEDSGGVGGYRVFEDKASDPVANMAR